MKFNKTQDSLTPNLERITRELARVPQQAADYFISVTPKRSGNARSQTKLVKETIVANYPYAQRLDNGWSRQAPNGMTKPTEQFIDRLVQKIIRK